MRAGSRELSAASAAWTAAALLALVALGGCSVDVTGAPCTTDQNCPEGQSCGSGGRCVSGGPGAGGCVDADGDGFGEGAACSGADCDDADPALGATGSRGCYTGPEATRSVGVCKDGTQVCSAGVWGACTGEVKPAAKESCGDGQDNDCSGTVDDPIACTPDTWVCATCDGADDANIGSQVYPFKTINQGLLAAQAQQKHVVHVANQDGETPAVYTEDVKLVEGISLEGRWNPAALPWTRESAARTVIQNVTPGTFFNGFYGDGNLTRATKVEGFEIRGAGAVNGSRKSVAVSILNGSPTLADVAIVGTPPGAPVPDESIGLQIAGVLGSPEPLLAGTESTPVSVTGGRANLKATGVAVNSGRLEAAFAEITGGVAAGTLDTRSSVVGVELINGRGTVIRSSTVKGGTAGACAAVAATGEVGDIVLEKGAFVGCQPDDTVTPGSGAGIVFLQCKPIVSLSQQPPVIRQNTLVSGGVGNNLGASGDKALMTGISALVGCPVQVRNNQEIDSGHAAEGANVDSAAGVLCSYSNLSGTTGADSACVVADNDQVLGGDGPSTGRAWGVICDGSCQSGASSCTGSCERIARNKVIAASADVPVQLLVAYSKPAIDRNALGLGAPSTCSTDARGVQVIGGEPVLTNNVITPGACPRGIAYEQINAPWTSNTTYFPSPTLNSNTLAILGGPGSSPPVVKLDVLRDAAGKPVPPLPPQKDNGIFSNNIFFRAEAGDGALFVEADPSCGPKWLGYNDFFDAQPGAGTGVYLRNGTTLVTTASALNDGTTGDGNVQLAPGFVSPPSDLHLQPGSPLLGAGPPGGSASPPVPNVDYDGDPRPSPTGTRPDIGADEAGS